MKPERIGLIAITFIELRNTIQIYHWQTKNYAKHKATDKLLKDLDIQVDKFIETLQGSENNTLKIGEIGNFKKHKSYQNISDKIILDILDRFKIWLVNTLPSYMKNENVDLYNIRDEILSSINQTLYLFTLS